MAAIFTGTPTLVVMPGLDPGIHLTGREMDCRVKPGNDDYKM
jgi:hypothetical protein